MYVKDIIVYLHSLKLKQYNMGDIMVSNKLNFSRNGLTTLQKYALMGFLLGDDNIGEDVEHILNKLTYHKLSNHYSMVVILRSNDDYTCTSGIGFHLKSDKSKVLVYSSKRVIEFTPDKEVLMAFENAEISKL